MNNDFLKEKHQIAICKDFISIYDKKIHFTKLGNPQKNEPDCLLSNGLAIELIGVYDNNYQAEKIWSYPRDTKTYKIPEHKLCRLDNLSKAIPKKLQKLEEGRYNGFNGKLILLCYFETKLLLDEREIENYISQYSPYRLDNWFKKYFHEIWIMWEDLTGDTKIRRLE